MQLKTLPAILTILLIIKDSTNNVSSITFLFSVSVLINSGGGGQKVAYIRVCGNVHNRMMFVVSVIHECIHWSMQLDHYLWRHRTK